MSQVSPMAEELTADEEVDFDMDKVKGGYLDMDKVEVEEALEAAVVTMEVVVEDME